MIADIQQLPASCQALAATIGTPAALRLLQRYPGRSLEVPVGVKKRGVKLYDELIALIGKSAAERLFNAYGDSTLYLPSCSKLARHVQYGLIQQRFTALTTIGKMKARQAVDDLVGEWNFSDRHIWRILKVALLQPAIPSAVVDTQLCLSF